jgi:secondary thiamine-phosphate synthase enzyme
MWLQRTIRLKARPRGFHLIDDEISAALPELVQCRVGLLHLWLQHTSASLSINENADALVRSDLEAMLRHLVPDSTPFFRHTCEGPDDMTAHVKTALLGVQLSIPVSSGRLAMGTWQGIYLGEHREDGGSRRLVATLQGEAG